MGPKLVFAYLAHWCDRSAGTNGYISSP